LADESYVQVLPDSSGKKIRNLSLSVVQPDGTTSTVLMQVVSIVDEAGKPYALAHAMPTEDQSTHELLLRIIELLEGLQEGT